jgi:hypothetical protein
MTRQELQEEFERQAEGRRSKANEYPDGTRNIEAAEIFDRLAATVGELWCVLAAYGQNLAI